MIDEKKLIAHLNDWMLQESFLRCMKNPADTIYECIKAVEEQPKIGGWIPMEEKLPPDGQKVLLSCNYMMFDYVTVGTIENGNRGKSYIADEDTFMRSAILAWQPLPNTYCK